MKQVTIHSDGFGADSIIVDDEGNTLDNVIEAVVRMEAREPNRVELTMWTPRLQAKGTVTNVDFVCPCCGDGLSHECGPTTIGG